MTPKQPELSTGGLRVITVCTGNICRSPMAEAILRAAVADSDLADSGIVVESAGTHSYHLGEDADRRARAALSEGGFPLHHRARQFQRSWFGRFDLILAMDSSHEAHLRSLASGQGVPQGRIRLFREFDPQAGSDLDVPDPYYDTIAEFREVREMLIRATPGVLAHLRELQSARGQGTDMLT